MKALLDHVVDAASEGMQRIHRVRRIENRRRVLQMEKIRLANRAAAAAGSEDLSAESRRIEEEEASLEQARREEADRLVALLEELEKSLDGLREQIEACLAKEKAGSLCEEEGAA